MDRRFAYACQYVIEELSTNRLASIAEEVGVSGKIARLTIHVPDSGVGAALEVDCHDLVDQGVSCDLLAIGNDQISDAFIAGYATLVDSNDSGLIV